MNGSDLFIILSPFLYIIMSAYILNRINYINKILNMWEIERLKIIPASFICLYSWILLFNPSLEMARYGLRCVLSFCLGVTCYILYSYTKKIKDVNTHV